MLPLTQQIIQRTFEGMIARIQENIRNKPIGRFGPMNASGKTAASLSYEILENEARIYGAGHIFALEFGRKPTENAGSGGSSLKDRIRVWIDDKGIEPQPGANGKPISKDSLAFLISRKIHNEGTILYKAGGNSGILSDVINEETTGELSEALFYEFEQIITSTLLKD